MYWTSTPRKKLIWHPKIAEVNEKFLESDVKYVLINKSLQINIKKSLALATFINDDVFYTHPIQKVV